MDYSSRTTNSTSLFRTLTRRRGKLAKGPKLTLFNPKNKKRVVKKLNNGLFRELLQLFVRKEWNHGVSTIPCLDPPVTMAASPGIRRLLTPLNAEPGHLLAQVIYLAVLSMQLGAKIPAKDLTYVHKTLNRTPMYEEAKAQVQKGVEGYRGEAWDFESKGLVEAANASSSAEEDSGNDITPCFRGFLSVNVSLGPGGFMLLNVMEIGS